MIKIEKCFISTFLKNLQKTSMSSIIMHLLTDNRKERGISSREFSLRVKLSTSKSCTGRVRRA